MRNTKDLSTALSRLQLCKGVHINFRGSTVYYACNSNYLDHPSTVIYVTPPYIMYSALIYSSSRHCLIWINLEKLVS